MELQAKEATLESIP
jgi:hypothetical protein